MKHLHLIVLGILLNISAVVVAQDKQAKMHQVVMQLNTADTAVWSSTLGNIRNFQKVWPGNCFNRSSRARESIEFFSD